METETVWGSFDTLSTPYSRFARLRMTWRERNCVSGIVEIARHVGIKGAGRASSLESQSRMPVLDATGLTE
jgi:hypothetical protein